MEPHPGLGPGEEVNDGLPTAPRIAASVIVVRGGAAALELLLVRRNPDVRFMGGVWVFPGGAVDPDDRGEEVDGLDGAVRAAAVREVAEEAGIVLDDPALLVPFSRWITPAHLMTRFDTWFFAAAAPPGAEATVDGSECVAAQWLSPAAALAAHRAETLPLVFPTIKLLEQLDRFATAEELLAAAAVGEVVPIEPRVVMVRDRAQVVLPGDPGYEAAGRRHRL